MQKIVYKIMTCLLSVTLISGCEGSGGVLLAAVDGFTGTDVTGVVGGNAEDSHNPKGKLIYEYDVDRKFKDDYCVYLNSSRTMDTWVTKKGTNKLPEPCRAPSTAQLEAQAYTRKLFNMPAAARIPTGTYSTEGYPKVCQQYVRQAAACANQIPALASVLRRKEDALKDMIGSKKVDAATLSQVCQNTMDEDQRIHGCLAVK